MSKRHVTERAAGQPHSMGTRGKGHPSERIGKRVLAEAGCPQCGLAQASAAETVPAKGASPAADANGNTFKNPPAPIGAQLQAGTYNASGGKY
jgi:hypothetical protein